MTHRIYSTYTYLGRLQHRDKLDKKSFPVDWVWETQLELLRVRERGICRFRQFPLYGESTLFSEERTESTKKTRRSKGCCLDIICSLNQIS